MQSKALTVQEYIRKLPPDRAAAISKVRKVIRQNLPRGFKEGMLWGLIGYHVPLRTYPDTYNGQPLFYAGLASQKNYMAVYLTDVYSDKATGNWFRKEFAKRGKKLDMGKSCVRFRKIEDLPLDVIGATIARFTMDQFIQYIERNHPKK